MLFVVFFFKQKTAYEMRISDWSSDVCSSDLIPDDAVLSRSVVAAKQRAQLLFALAGIVSGGFVVTGHVLLLLRLPRKLASGGRRCINHRGNIVCKAYAPCNYRSSVGCDLAFSLSVIDRKSVV